MNSATVTDFSQYNELRRIAKDDQRQGIEQVAKQFEALFMQMMLKSMRAASMGDPLFDSEQMDFYRDMHDQQLAMDLSSKQGIGLADALVRQLSRYVPEQAGSTAPAKPLHRSTAVTELPAITGREKSYTQHVYFNPPEQEMPEFTTNEEFIEHIWPHAQAAAHELGVSPEILIAQAALETGWGKKIIQRQNGESSFNLFNIKADHRWDGGKVVKQTIEFEDGVARPQRAAFRAYGSVQDSFDDYVDFLKQHGRYRNALQSNTDEEFMSELKQAGYATDPHYVKKVMDIVNRPEFRQQTELDNRES